MGSPARSYADNGGFWLADHPLILASASPVRSLMLKQANIPHWIVPANVDERALQAAEQAPQASEIATYLALQKSLAVSRKYPDHFVLGADQVCYCDNAILHKATDAADLSQKLWRLRGKTHALVSAAALTRKGAIVAQCRSEARLTMRAFSEDFLRRYIEQGGTDLLHSAGGYMIERNGITLFESIIGDQFTILGLPMLDILRVLREYDLLLR